MSAGWSWEHFPEIEDRYAPEFDVDKKTPDADHPAVRGRHDRW